MSGFTENRTPGASEYAGAPARLLTWQAAKAMLPLVGRVAEDVQGATRRANTLRAEQAHLDEVRRVLDWPARRRRYQLDEDLAEIDADLRRWISELETLGVTLLDGRRGLIGFPTMVNQRRAFFSWQVGEPELGFWQYAGDENRREVPADWIANPPGRIVKPSKPRHSR